MLSQLAVPSPADEPSLQSSYLQLASMRRYHRQQDWLCQRWQAQDAFRDPASLCYALISWQTRMVYSRSDEIIRMGRQRRPAATRSLWVESYLVRGYWDSLKRHNLWFARRGDVLRRPDILYHLYCMWKQERCSRKIPWPSALSARNQRRQW